MQAPDLRRRRPAAPPDLMAVESLVDRHMAGDAQPGLAYGIVQDGVLVHAGGRGVARVGGGVPDASTVFRIASMTKSFTAAAVLLLRDQGALRLDDEVSRYVPEAGALQPPTDDAPPLTVRTLLTMTGGLPTDDPWGDRQQDLPDDAFAELLSGGLSFAWTPGTAYEYSNLGYALLGRVVAAAAGEPYAQVVTRRLLAPLGMASTGWTADVVPRERLAQGYRPGEAATPRWEEVPFAGYGAFAPMGGLFSSVADLARWIGGFTAAYPPRPDRPEDGDAAHPLRRASRREQQQPHRSLPPQVTWRSLAEPPVVRGQAYGFGLVWELDPSVGEIVSHSGGYPGFGSHMRWHPAGGHGVVVLGNATYTPAAVLGAQLMDLLLTGPAGPTSGSAMRARGSAAMVAAAQRARADVDRLIEAWDDELAASLLASNVDQDEPLGRRRAAIERIQRTIGPLRPDPDAPVTSVSPAHCAWWLVGPGGRARVEIRLTPQLPPRVQTLNVTVVAHPPEAVQALAVELAAALAEPDPGWPASWRAPADPAGELPAALRVAAAWAGACTVAEVVSGDGESEAGFRLAGRRSLRLHLTWTPGTTELTSLSLTPA